MAWASCYSPDYRVVSIVGASTGTTAANDRRLVELFTDTGGSGSVFTIDKIDVGRYATKIIPSAGAMSISLAKMAATPRYIGAMFRFQCDSVNGWSNSAGTICVMPASTAGQSVQLRGNSSTGVLAYSFDNGSTWTNSSQTLTAGTTYRIEMFVDFGVSTTHTLKVRVDAVEVINTTGGTATSTGGDPLFGSPATQSVSFWYSDLVTYNDVAQYGTMDDWRVWCLKPASDGAHSMTSGDFQFQDASPLSNATTTAWSHLTIPSDLTGTLFWQQVTRTTSYVEIVLESLASGYGNPVLVCLAATMGPIGAQTANSVAFRLNSGGNVSAEAAIDTSISTGNPEYRKHHYTTEPSTSAAWTVAMAQAPLRARFGFSGDATPSPACGALAAFVVAPVATAATVIPDVMVARSRP